MRRWTVIAAGSAGVVVVLLVAGAAGLYLERTGLARRAAETWLAQQGVPGDVEIQSMSARHAVARIRLGSAQHPDLTVGKVEADYSLDSLIHGKGPALSFVRLTDPVLTGRWHDGKLDLGAVNQLIAKLQPPPGRPSAPPPRIEVRQGRVRLATDYGAIDAAGDADLDQGRLTRLTARLAPTRLRGQGVDAQLGQTTANATLAGDRLRIGLSAPASELHAAADLLKDVTVTLQADLSYAALMLGRADGRLNAEIKAASAEGAGMTAKALGVQLQAPSLAYDSRSGALTAAYHVRTDTGAIAQLGVSLANLTTDGGGKVQSGKDGLAFDWSGKVSGQGRAPLLGKPSKDEEPVMQAAQRALQDFRFTLAGAEVSAAKGVLATKLTKPIHVQSRSGGALDLAPAGAGYGLTLAGGGLPETKARIGKLTFTDTGVSVPLSLTTAFSFGLLDGAKVKAGGRATLRGAALAFTATSCADVTARRIDLDDNSIDGFKAALCPGKGPMLSLAPGGWSIAGEAKGVSGQAAMVQAGLADGAGAMRLAGRGKTFNADVTIAKATVSDLAKPLRYHPLTLSGHAAVDGGIAVSSLDFHTPRQAAPIAHAEVRHDLDAKTGGVDIAVPALTFAQGALQPTDLSPLTAAIGEPASGVIDFTGRMDWAGKAVTSGGTLTIRRLDFKSPAGVVTNFTGQLALTSLTPDIEGHSVGRLHADRIAGPILMTDVSATTVIADQVATVPDGRATVGGGLAELTAALPLDDAQTMPVKGEVALSHVQIHDLVEASPFGDKLDLDAQLSGRLPFEALGDKVRLSSGTLKADQPGRLSVSRQALNPGDAAKEDTITGFAYQALENLAFDALDATVQSRPDGRLGVLFHIKGRHDPPKHQELVLTWMDVIQQKFLGKPLPLPSDVAVDLTLDTTLNLDDLIHQYGDLHRPNLDLTGGSASVQPTPAKVGAEQDKHP